MKFPYGLSDFGKLIQGGYWYQDRTDRLPLIEATGDQLLFLRPRRFGKSLWLSMLEHYYDLNRADHFETLFGRLAVGRAPTPLRNGYLVMKWDFSLVQAQGEVKDIEAALHRYLYALDNPVQLVDVSGLSSREGTVTVQDSKGSSDRYHESLMTNGNSWIDFKGGFLSLTFDVMQEAHNWKIVHVAKGAMGYWRKVPRVGVAGKIANSGALETLGTIVQLGGVLVNGYNELSDRGYRLDQIAPAWWNAPQNIREASSDELINAFSEGVTSATVITLKAIPFVGGFFDFSGQDLQRSIEDFVDF